MLTALYSKEFDKCVKTFIHYFSIIQNDSFTVILSHLIFKKNDRIHEVKIAFTLYPLFSSCSASSFHFSPSCSVCLMVTSSRCITEAPFRTAAGLSADDQRRGGETDQGVYPLFCMASYDWTMAVFLSTFPVVDPLPQVELSSGPRKILSLIPSRLRVVIHSYFN